MVVKVDLKGGGDVFNYLNWLLRCWVCGGGGGEGRAKCPCRQRQRLLVMMMLKAGGKCRETIGTGFD